MLKIPTPLSQGDLKASIHLFSQGVEGWEPTGGLKHFDVTKFEFSGNGSEFVGKSVGGTPSLTKVLFEGEAELELGAALEFVDFVRCRPSPHADWDFGFRITNTGELPDVCPFFCGETGRIMLDYCGRDKDPGLSAVVDQATAVQTAAEAVEFLKRPSSAILLGPSIWFSYLEWDVPDELPAGAPEFAAIDEIFSYFCAMVGKVAVELRVGNASDLLYGSGQGSLLIGGRGFDVCCGSLEGGEYGEIDLVARRLPTGEYELHVSDENGRFGTTVDSFEVAGLRFTAPSD